MTSTSTPRQTPEGPPDNSLRSAILTPVFVPAAATIIGLVLIVILFRDQAEDATGELNKWITDGVGWWYVIAVNIFLGFTAYFAFSKIGRIKLGRDDEQPEFGVISWFMMLFSAGMGIGLVFFGVAEPLGNYVAPPEAYGNSAKSAGAAQDSVGLMMLHWGVHPWAIYALVGLGLAYMSFRRGRPLAVRWLLEPLLGRRRIEGWMGHAIDAIAIIGTLFGVATSFGFGVSQIIAGLEFMGWAEKSDLLIIVIITCVTAMATWSVVSGVHKGLKWLSNINMTIAALLALTIFIVGPTIFLLKAVPENAGSYLSQLPQTMFHTGPYANDGWEAVWPIAYWGWWTSWAPFVGMFIARISRGRTIREFLLGVLLAPTVASLVWFTIFGDGSILAARDGSMSVGDEVNNTTSLFQYFETFPGGLASVLSVVAMTVVVFFFVTSSDSGSLVIDMLSCGGRTETPVATRVFWAVLEGVVAAVLLIVGGAAALTALQTLSISTAAPFSVILVLGCISLNRAFRHDVATMPNYMQVIPPPTTGPAPTQETPAETIRRGIRGIGNVSTTYAGLEDDEREQQEADSQIISFRHVDPNSLSIDPETGSPTVDGEAEDPLAGQTFDTPEFESSQEYVNQGGVIESAPDDEEETEPAN